MILRTLLLLAFLAAPAEAVSITDLRLNCDGTWLAPGAVVTDATCRGQGLWLDARLTGFPVAIPPVGRFALTVDGTLVGERTVTLPAVLPDCYRCGAPYEGLGLGWQLPLACAEGCTGVAVASFALVGGDDPDVAFTLDVPTPEPATLALVGLTLAFVGWRLRR